MVEGSVAMVEAIQRHRFSVEDYIKMVEAGILTEDDKVELIHGEIVAMTPIGTRHIACVNRLNHLFGELRESTLLSNQNAVRLADSMPEPDFVLLAWRDDFYADAYARSADVQLIVEVAETSLRFDREVKGPLYAANGFREYWIVDLEKARVEVHRRPEGREWKEIRVLGREDSIAPEAFPEFEVPLDSVLP